MSRGCWILLMIGTLAGPEGASAKGNRELNMHLAQANNQSPYAFVRAKFEPGELADPWAVRFFDERGTEVPYFVWDSVTWQVERGSGRLGASLRVDQPCPRQLAGRVGSP